MKTVSIIGHFALNRESLNGQTIKTKVITSQLKEVFGNGNVGIYDTHGGITALLKLPYTALSSLTCSLNTVIMPAQNGIKVIPAFLVMFNIIFRRRIHYVVIGGWLPDVLKNRPFLRTTMRKLHMIYVETLSMKRELEAMGVANVTVMPNCKHLDIVHEEDLQTDFRAPFKLCTFSRVTKEKGIEDAITAVNEANIALKSKTFTLDIYGQVEDDAWFDGVISKQDSGTIRYNGTVPFNKSTEILSQYFLLLFPTYYPGECFAGTIIDAFSAGLPTVASDWHANAEIIINGYNGIIFPTRSTQALTEILLDIAKNPEQLTILRKNCIKTAIKYQPKHIVNILTEEFKTALQQ